LSLHKRLFCRSPEIPRRFQRTPDIGVFRTGVERNQPYAMRALGLISRPQSLRALMEYLAAIGTDNLDAIGHEFSVAIPGRRRSIAGIVGNTGSQEPPPYATATMVKASLR
jgi:hypothetical protein